MTDFCRVFTHETEVTRGLKKNAATEQLMPAPPLHLAQTVLPQCPCSIGWVPFTRVHLGQRAKKICAKPLAEHATPNRTEGANDRCRTPDDSTAEEKHSNYSRTNIAPRQAPVWAPFTFQRLSCGLRRTTHGRFVKARPARPTSTRLHSRHAH